ADRDGGRTRLFTGLGVADLRGLRGGDDGRAVRRRLLPAPLWRDECHARLRGFGGGGDRLYRAWLDAMDGRGRGGDVGDRGLAWLSGGAVRRRPWGRGRG